MRLRNRIEKLELSRQSEKPTSPHSPARIREEAERSIERSLREGREPVFQITEDGGVHTRDGRPVTDYRQTLADEFYQWELEWHQGGSSELVFDADAEAFYTSDGELALSRTYVSLPRLMGEGGGS